MAYTLPALDYDYGDLAPAISGEIMELHHSKHHAAYVAGANTAQEKLAEARDKADFAAIPKLEKDLAFHLGGHINHSIFWKNMSPNGGGAPTGAAFTSCPGRTRCSPSAITVSPPCSPASITTWSRSVWPSVTGRRCAFFSASTTIT